MTGEGQNGDPMAVLFSGDKERARTQLEDAVYRAIEAGMTHDEVLEEVRYVLESVDA